MPVQKILVSDRIHSRVSVDVDDDGDLTIRDCRNDTEMLVAAEDIGAFIELIQEAVSKPKQ